MADEQEIVIFYSWQNDLPKTTNLQAIRTALRVASSNVEKDLAVRNLSNPVSLEPQQLLP